MNKQTCSNIQQLLIYGYVQQFQNIHSLSMNVAQEIIAIIYLFYKKKRVINEWICGDLIHCNHDPQFTIKIRKARHFKTGQIAVLKTKDTQKFIARIQMTSKQMDQISLQEFNVLKTLRHENILQPIEFHTDTQQNADDSHTHILYIYDLNHYCLLFDIVLFIGHLNENAARSYFSQIIDGLHALHQISFSPSKISQHHLFLDRSFTLKIMVDESDHKHIQIDKSQPAQNIFDCGVLLFTIYAGFPPFNSQSHTDWWWDKLSKGWKYLVASEKQKYQKDRDKYIAASMRKIQLFWKAHERTRVFPNKLKNIIVNCLHPFTKYRYKMKHVLQHEWYTEEDGTYNRKQLQQYMKDALHATRNELMHKLKIKQAERKLCTDMHADEFRQRAKELDPYNEFMENIDVLKDDLLIHYGTNQFYTHCEPSEIVARLEKGCKMKLIECNADDCVVLLQTIVSYDSGDEDQEVMILCKQYLVNKSNPKLYLVKFSNIQGLYSGFSLVIKSIYNCNEIMDVMEFI